MNGPEVQAGPLMKRVTVAGAQHIIPADAKLSDLFPANGTAEEKQAWLEKQMNEPLGGTW